MGDNRRAQEEEKTAEKEVGWLQYVTLQYEMHWVTAIKSTVLLSGVNLYKLHDQISAVAENSISCFKAKICNKILQEAMKKQ